MCAAPVARCGGAVSALQTPDWEALDADLSAEAGVVIRQPFRCEQPSKYAGWLLADGTVVPARCGATNRCAYCAYQRVIEDALVVSMDAIRHGYPRVGMTLTTLDPHHDLVRFRRDVEQVFRMVRRELGDDVGYLGMMEWTTGRGERSGGHRRVHQHVLLRRCLPSEAEAIEDSVRRLWAKRTGASRVELRELRTPAGATAYLIHHHRKRDQAPPPGFRGKRLRPSKNYYGEPVAQLREQAALQLRCKRLRKIANRMIEWEALDGAPEEHIDHELREAFEEAKRDADMVTFVKLDHKGGIYSYKPSNGPWTARADAARAA